MPPSAYCLPAPPLRPGAPWDAPQPLFAVVSRDNAAMQPFPGQVGLLRQSAGYSVPASTVTAASMSMPFTAAGYGSLGGLPANMFGTTAVTHEQIYGHAAGAPMTAYGAPSSAGFGSAGGYLMSMQAPPGVLPMHGGMRVPLGLGDMRSEVVTNTIHAGHATGGADLVHAPPAPVGVASGGQLQAGAVAAVGAAPAAPELLLSGLPWSEESLAILKSAVDENGTKAWVDVARAVNDGHTAADCLVQYSKLPGVTLKNSGYFCATEDDLLIDAVERCQNPSAPRWVDIARRVPSRSAKQVRERWLNHLDPAVQHTPWTDEEDRLLRVVRQSRGNAWVRISELMPGRSANSIKNRWHTVLAPGHSGAAVGAPAVYQASAAPQLPVSRTFGMTPGVLSAEGGAGDPAIHAVHAHGGAGFYGASTSVHATRPAERPSGSPSTAGAGAGEQARSVAEGDAPAAGGAGGEAAHSGASRRGSRVEGASRRRVFHSGLPGQQPRKGTWTPAEDEALARAAARHGQKNWHLVAEELGFTRTPQQCMHHYTTVLAHDLRKGPWTIEEDAIVAAHAAKFVARGEPIRWSQIAEHVRRSHKQIRERYLNHLDPNILRTEFSPAEDALLIQLQAQHGNKWAMIAKMMPGRPENTVKNRFNQLTKLSRGTG